jgi:hypothetical protein
MNGNEIGKPKRTFKTKEEWHDWVMSKAGSIDDETFVRPVDFYEDFYNKHKDEVLS